MNDDKKSLRFTEEEKSVLFSLFGKYKDVIDIRHRRNSQSQHKQVALRKCWDSILDSFNAHPDTSKRSMKQIQKFWLNSKLRKRLPDDKEGSKTCEKRSRIIEIKGSPSKKSNDAAYQELVKTCKESDNEDDENSDRKMSLDTTDEIALSETNVTNGEQYEDEQYDPLGDSYFQNDAITLKVIDDPIDLDLAAPAPSSIVTIPAQTQRGTTLVTLPSQSYEHVKKQEASPTSQSASVQPTTAYITYSPSSTATLANQNIQLVKSANGNYLITTPASNSTPQVIRGSRLSQASPTITATSSLSMKDTENASLQDLQKQEALLRIREAKIRCEVQEIEKEKAREELLQMREVHRMKIKEMETRLRNMERS